LRPQLSDLRGRIGNAFGLFISNLITPFMEFRELHFFLMLLFLPFCKHAVHHLNDLLDGRHICSRGKHSWGTENGQANHSKAQHDFVRMRIK
jgi:hypothetical protein